MRRGRASAANAPLSSPPVNFIWWVRSATLDFYTKERARVGKDVETRIVRLDPDLDKIIPPGTKIEKLADGFGFTEGPVWVPGEPGYLLFSDPNNNTIYRWPRQDKCN
jgi:gluconolactonase